MKKNLLVLLFFIFTTAGIAQKNFWNPVKESDALSNAKSSNLFAGKFKPTVYQLYNLNENDLVNALRQAPLKTNAAVQNSSFILSVPVANGSIEHFRVTESPVMEPKLQAKYPSIKTYAGVGVEDASDAIYFDHTPLGFHAMIISPEKSTVYINPLSAENQLYVVFDRNASPEKRVFDCKLDQILNSNIQGTEKPLTISDANLRTYRFAVTTGGEFSQLCLTGHETTDAQRKASVLSVLTTDLVRTNGIFETDFGVHLNYVNDEDAIIFLNGSSDPYLSSTSGYTSGVWNTQCQKTLNSYIGSSNYDIGHLLMGYPTGGNAGCIGCVCNKSNKGSGVTGFTDDLTTDPFIVDFWDHEIGHQFGANHTFDYSYEGTIAQMEPGSGSTIMGYAGTTGQYDVQPHSDPYFHAASIQQVNAYIKTGGGASCAVVTSTGNSVPTVAAGKDYIIPKSTPFTLKAVGSDGNTNDSLTYCWEQYDDVTNNSSPSAIPTSTATKGPVFRSLKPVKSPNRPFPALTSILNGSNTNKWEVLPSVSRTLNFRVTVRDNHKGGGSTSSDDMIVTVDGASGPFKVTSPNTSVSWAAGSQHTITWNVANSNVAPVSCTKVNIMLSLDGGKTFPVKLKSNVINDGSATVVLPSNTTTKARIKVVAVGNIFFDISDANFSITAARVENSIATSFTPIAQFISVKPNPTNTYTNVIFNKAAGVCTITLADADGKFVWSKTVNATTKGSIEKVDVSRFSKGVYFITVSSASEKQTEKIIIN